MNFQFSGNVNPENVFLVNRSNLIGRIDPSVYKKAFVFESKIYDNVRLSEIAEINPVTSFARLNPEQEITFVPMEAVSDENGVIKSQYKKTVKATKGFTRFKQNDLIWAKITPCMQNGKSAVVKHTLNGYACGSTEFFVIRPKGDEVLVDYLHFLLRDEKILQTAQNFFGGSAGQQRVDRIFLHNFLVPKAPIDVQEKIVQIIHSAYVLKQEKEVEGIRLLQSIDTYLLRHLGIVLPEINSSISNRIFTVNFSDVTGNRVDPKLYDISTRLLKKAIASSDFRKVRLREIIVQSISGDWGKDPDEELSDDYTKCLVIRATEFDNDGNLRLENSRVKYRLIHKDKVQKIDLKPDDLLIEKSGGSPDQPVGRVALITDDIYNSNQLCFSNFIYKFRVNHNLANSRYIFFLLKMLYNIRLTDAMQSQTNGIRNLIMSNYLNQFIPLPDLDVQNNIVVEIDKLYSKSNVLRQEALELITSANQQIEKLLIG